MAALGHESRVESTVALRTRFLAGKLPSPLAELRLGEERWKIRKRLLLGNFGRYIEETRDSDVSRS